MVSLQVNIRQSLAAVEWLIDILIQLELILSKKLAVSGQPWNIAAHNVGRRIRRGHCDGGTKRP